MLTAVKQQQGVPLLLLLLLLQSVTNSTIHGIPVYFATPQGLSSQANSSKLLVYLHGGAYIKGSCNNLWQVRLTI